MENNPLVTKILQGEGLFTFILFLGVYYFLGHSWGLFFALFLIPDLGLLGYLGDARAFGYNCDPQLYRPPSGELDHFMAL